MPPFILAMPSSFYSSIYKLQAKENSRESGKEVPILQSAQSMGSSLFSRISGVKAYSYQTMVCVLNKNVPLLNNEARDPETLVDKTEAGAMEIVIKYPDGTNVSLYAPRKFMPSCTELKTDISTTSPAYLANNPVFRNPFPIGQPVIESSGNGPIIKVPVYQTTGIDFSKTIIFAIPMLYSKEFGLNITIFLIAWTLVYVHLIKLYLFSCKVYSWTHSTKSENRKSRKVFKK